MCHQYHDGLIKGHFHCPTCRKIIRKKENLKNHVKSCVVQELDPDLAPKLDETSNQSLSDSIPTNIAEDADTQVTEESVPTSTVGGQSSEGNQGRSKKITCTICGKFVSKRWIKKHIKNHDHSLKSISENYHHKTVIISASDGIFCSSRNIKGPSHPVHIIKKTSGNNLESFCDNLSCIELKETAKRGGNMTYECPHLLSTPYAIPGKIIEMRNDTLDDLKENNFFTDDRYQQLRNFKGTATNSPLIVQLPSDAYTSDRYVFLSIITGSTRYWSKTGRTIVTFDKEKNTYTCKCSVSKRYCLHKAIGKWFVYQEMPDYFGTATDDFDGEADELEGVSYSDENTNAPNDIKDITVYIKICPKCRRIYRYQEWGDGFHNFNNSLLIGLDVCLLLRAGLQAHVALGRTISMLEDMLNEKLNHMDIVNAYLHFEALTEHKYEFNCVLCGYYPSILIWDTFRKARFRFAASDLNVPTSDEDILDTVDTDMFWNGIKNSVISRGFGEDLAKQLTIKPNFEAWAPWIGEKSRFGNMLVNTEYKKCTPVNQEEVNEPMPEELLTSLLVDEKITDIRKICRESGVSCKGSRMDMILRLRQMSITRSSFDRAYEKVFGCSGGWAVGCCKHGIIYAIKNLLRSESPRDYVDLERSLKHRPNVTLCDIAHLVASHANRQFPTFFQPYDGRLAEVSNETIDAAERGTVSYGLPFLKETCTSNGDDNTDQNYNPITSSINHLSLFDWFHQDNCKKREEVLRKCSLVDDINGLVDTQAVEQVFSSSKKDIYFLNNMSVGNHLFLFRLLYHLKNKKKNQTIIARQSAAFGHSLYYNHFGQLSQRIGDSIDEVVKDQINCNQNDHEREEGTEATSHEFMNPDYVVYVAEPIREELLESTLHEPTNESGNMANPITNSIKKQDDIQGKDLVEVELHDDIININISSLSNEQLTIFHKNRRYIQEVLLQQPDKHRIDQVKIVDTPLGLFQVQGFTNYCGVCCINNAIGFDVSHSVTTVKEFDDVADQLWMSMAKNPSHGLAVPLEPMRDKEGFYSIEVLECILRLRGYEMIKLDPSAIRPMNPSEAGSYLIQQLKKEFHMAVFIIHPKSSNHWITIKVTNDNNILFLDSQRPLPHLLTFDDLGAYILSNSEDPGAVYFLSPAHDVLNHVSTQKLKNEIESPVAVSPSYPREPDYKVTTEPVTPLSTEDIAEPDYMETTEPVTPLSTDDTAESTTEETYPSESYNLRQSPNKKRMNSFIYDVPHKRKRIKLKKPVPCDTTDGDAQSDIGWDCELPEIRSRTPSPVANPSAKQPSAKDILAIISETKEKLENYRRGKNPHQLHRKHGLACEIYAYFNNILTGNKLKPAGECLFWSNRLDQKIAGVTNGHHSIKYVDSILLADGYDEFMNDENALFSIMFHEFVHAYLMVNGLKDKSPHGPVFQGAFKKLLSIVKKKLSPSTGKNPTNEDRQESCLF